MLPPQSRGPTPGWLQKTEEDCKKPLVLTMPVAHNAKHGGDGMRLQRRQQSKSHVFLERSRIGGPNLLKACLCLIVPPLIFGWTMTFLSFNLHFKWPKRVWPIAAVAILPVLLATWNAYRQWRTGLDNRWALGSAFLGVVAFAGGMLAGDINYLLNFHHYYFIHSLKSYANVNPADANGLQLMDAGRVKFAEGSKLLIDMGMSFTMWDTYCVAPIGTAESGSVNQQNPGPTLAAYDLWAVGKNCCSTDNPTFACGQYQNINAKSGLRQSNENERAFFALAVQQAEAAYAINAKHPIFFHWVEDADASMQNFFNKGFRGWVILLAFHWCINAFAVYLMLNSFKYPRGALLAD